MAVAFDAVGPSSSGQVSTASPTTWAHVNNGNCIVVIANWVTGGTSTITAVTYGAVSLSRIAQVAGGGGTAGGCDVWGVISGTLPTGSNTVTVTGGGPGASNHVCCGSLSFSGAVSFGTPVTNSATAGTLSVTVGGTAAGGMIVAGATFGGSFVSATANSPGTLQFSAIGDTNGGADQTFGQTCASPGGSQAVGFTWSSGSDFVGLAAVEVTGAGGTPAQGPRPQRGGRRYRSHFGHRMTPQPALLAPQNVTVNAGAPTATGVATPVVFPTYITGLASPTGASYFTDNHGSPRMWAGDEIWALLTNAGRWNSGNYQATFDSYFATRAAQGYTVCYSDMFNSTFIGGAANGQMWNGQTPFTSNNPSSGLNNSYWQVIDYALSSAFTNGITLALSFGGHWDWDVSGNAMFGFTGTQYQDAGNAIGTRYKGQQNLVWLIMDDYFGSFDSSLSSLLTGLRASGDTHPIAIENYAETTSRKDLSTAGSLSWGASNTQYNFCYSYSCTYLSVEAAFAEASPLTPIYGDGYFYQGGSTYQGGSGAGALDRAARQDAWWAVTSGARGWDLGDEALWQWASTAPAMVSTQWFAANNLGNIRTFMESLPGWQTLAPDTSSVLVTAGRGTRGSQLTSGGGGGQYEPATTNSFVSASRTPDGGSGSALAVMYLPNATTITIDQTKIASGYTAYWVDPITGAKTSTTTGTTYNSTAKGNNSQGDPDWVLLLQGPPGANITAGIPTATGTAAQPVVTVSVLAGIPAATGTAPQPAASVSARAGIPAAAGTAPGPVPAISVLPGIPVATGTAPAPSVPTGTTVNAPAVTATGTPPQPVVSETDFAGIPSGTGSAAAVASPAALAGLASATGAAPAAVVSISVLAGIPAATGAAPAPSVLTGTTVNAGIPTATGTAPGPMPAVSVLPPAATATGTAPQPVTAHTATAGIPSATGAAAAVASISALAGIPAATGTAAQPVASISVLPGIPVATGNVAAPVLVTGLAVTAPAVTATGTAPQPAAAATVFAGLAAATGTAPATSHGVTAGIPAATGTAAQAKTAATIFAIIPAAAATAPAAQAQSVIPAVFGTALATATTITAATPGGQAATQATPSGTQLATATAGGQP